MTCVVMAVVVMMIAVRCRRVMSLPGGLAEEWDKPWAVLKHPRSVFRSSCVLYCVRHRSRGARVATPQKCAIERGPYHGNGTRLTFLFRFEMCSFIVGKYEFILPSGSRMVVR